MPTCADIIAVALLCRTHLRPQTFGVCGGAAGLRADFSACGCVNFPDLGIERANLGQAGQ
ncbi:MAG: hypothetical protein ABSA52_25255 [Candidatus Binatia bacterium]|jgi:hypothetical protein